MKLSLFRTLTLFAVFACTSATARATSYYWFGDDTTLGGAGTWSTASAAYWGVGGTDSYTSYTWGNADRANDSAYFESTGGAVALDSSVSLAGLVINGSDYSFSGGTLSIGSGGITANQDVTVASTIALTAKQTWAVASGKTLTYSQTSVVRDSAGLNVNLASGGSVAWNATLTNSIIGPWATVTDTSGVLRYATVSGGYVTGNTGTSATMGGIATTTAGLSVNYEVTSISGLAANSYANTVRFSGLSCSSTSFCNLNNRVLTTNGIMAYNATSGQDLYIVTGSPTAGYITTPNGTGDLVISGNQNIYFYEPIGVRYAIGITGTSTRLVSNNTGTVSVWTASNGGGIVVNSGVLRMVSYYTGAGALIVNSGAEFQSEGLWTLGFSATASVPTVTLNGGTLNFTAGAVGTSGIGATTVTMTGATIKGTNGFGWYAGRTTTPTLVVSASTVSSVISCSMGLRLNNTTTGTLTINVADGAATDDLLISGTICDGGISYSGGDILKTGLGVLTLSGSNTYSGTTTVNAGILKLSRAGSQTTATLTKSVLVVNAGGEVQSAATWALGYTSGYCVPTIALNGGTLSFTTGGTGTTGFAASTVSMTAGTIRASSSGTGFGWFNGLTTTPTLVANASSNSSLISTDMALRLGSSGYLTCNVADGAAAVDLLVSGRIVNATTASEQGAGLKKTGEGVMVLAGVNTYTGATYVNAGVLAIAVSGSINNSKVYVASAGNASGDGSFTGSYAKFARQYTAAYSGLNSTISGGAFASSATVGGNVSSGTDTVVMAWSKRSDSEASVLLSDVLNLTGASNATTLAMTYDTDTLAARGMDTSSLYIAYWNGADWVDAATMFGGSYNTSTSGTIVLSGSTTMSGTFAVVPEPGTLALLAGALLGLIAYAWRKRN